MSRKTLWGAFATLMVLAASACSSEYRATSPKEVRALAGSPEAVAAREEAERNLRNIVETYAEHTPLALGLVVVHDECIGGRARRWLDPDGEEPYKIRCSMRVTAYYGAAPERIVSVLDGILAVGDRTGSGIAFTHHVDGPLVDQYRDGRDQEPEAPELSAPGQTLSWDPVRDDRPYLVFEEPQECPAGDLPLTRCVRDPESGTVAAVRKRHGMVFRLALTAPDYYRVLKKG
ncbi:hypothetical protein AB0N42_33515 [Streptomyces pseudogriseolus]|uniref:Lipoprotein n=1 Tax=Streptomyces pseudogriseolus TaxID=36817 RepID=A0ABQ2TJY7_STREZ|nr:hypothetical protein [Streptomyces rubiginosus]GGS74239.1 hypothetical protein GCM10010285_61270 [Streptomyces rubiginosus]